MGVSPPSAALTTDASEGIDMADSDSTPGKSPAFQFYPKDFLTSEHVRLMSLTERGAYITLICNCWIEGSLPSNVDHLARLCGTPAAAFRKIWPSMQPCFRPHGTTGRLVHPRLERERKKQREYRKLQSEKGKASAASRRAHTVEPDGNRGSTAVQPDTRSPVQPEVNSSSSVFDLRSADSGQKSVSRARGITGGVMAGSLPRDHVQCRQPCERVCVSQRQHGILLARHGGTEADLDAFYADVRARLDPSVPIGDRPWEFWDKQFQARFGALAPAGKTAGNRAAADAFVARGRA